MYCATAAVTSLPFGRSLATSVLTKVVNGTPICVGCSMSTSTPSMSCFLR